MITTKLEPLTISSRLNEAKRPKYTKTMGVSIFSGLKQIPYDEAYTVLQAFNQDPSPEKITLGAGVYRDDNAKPWTLPSVKMVIHHE